MSLCVYLACFVFMIRIVGVGASLRRVARHSLDIAGVAAEFETNYVAALDPVVLRNSACVINAELRTQLDAVLGNDMFSAGVAPRNDYAVSAKFAHVVGSPVSEASLGVGASLRLAARHSFTWSWQVRR